MRCKDMIECKLRNTKFLTEIEMQNGFHILPAIVDTGAAMSVLNIQHVVDIAGLSKDTVRSFIEDNSGIEISPYASGGVKCIPAHLRNVTIFKELNLNEFHFVLYPVDNSPAIIGMDLLGAMNWQYDVSSRKMVFTSFSGFEYIKRVMSFTGKRTTEELCLLSKNGISNLLKQAEGN